MVDRSAAVAHLLERRVAPPERSLGGGRVAREQLHRRGVVRDGRVQREAELLERRLARAEQLAGLVEAALHRVQARERLEHLGHGRRGCRSTSSRIASQRRIAPATGAGPKKSEDAIQTQGLGALVLGAARSRRARPPRPTRPAASSALPLDPVAPRAQPQRGGEPVLVTGAAEHRQHPRPRPPPPRRAAPDSPRWSLRNWRWTSAWAAAALVAGGVRGAGRACVQRTRPRPPAGPPRSARRPGRAAARPARVEALGERAPPARAA